MAKENAQQGSVRLGDFEFDPGSGELARPRADGGREVRRLPPQPAHLLALLIEKRGELLTREEIRARLWPDVEVDFDQGLHFCVRQVRAALGDSAGASRYVETLPRRGYRLLQPVEAVALKQPVGGGEGAEDRVRRTARALPALLALAALVLIAAALALRTSTRPPPRIAVMPFRAPPGLAAGADTESIGEGILLELTRAAGDRAEVIGPRTTGRYDASSASLRRMAADLDLDYVVNGRFLAGDDGPRLLVELIRLPDGAHIWVESFTDLAAWREISGVTARAVVAALKLRRGSSPTATADERSPT